MAQIQEPLSLLPLGLFAVLLAREHLGRRPDDEVPPVPLQEREREVAGREEADHPGIVNGAGLKKRRTQS